MIIISMMGGLGNQMFQYAAAKNLSIISDTTLKIDASNFRKLTANQEHVFQLNCFKISAEQAQREEIKKFKPSGDRVNKILRRIAGAFMSRSNEINPNLLYEEPHGSEFRPGFFNLGPDRYLMGYFNSYKYFDPIRSLLLEEYKPKSEISAEARAVINEIENSNSVSIHIRRGDYIHDPNVRKGLEGIITERYYRNAVELVSSRVTNAHFFVFSNDMDWVKINFKMPLNVTYIDINSPQKGYEDLWIMSRCKHNITAGGSTFSWWAAYLNQNANKIVVRTERINNDPKYNHPEDYFPPQWEIVAS
ncbi:MAG TPA: alpha-1,2-fucosyltransferase [Syntrophales bacterium]|nr:alpha-1,2-fucosyltransferase [Syntrophales bacterium]